MADSHILGKSGEDKAAEHLRNLGYTIRHRNWNSGRTEIDIVAENKDFIVFVEVKTRTNDTFVKPAVAVTPQKQRTIIFAAEIYIRKYGIAKESRFDIITILNKGEAYIENRKSILFPLNRLLIIKTVLAIQIQEL
jgi:putative endonuclease